MANETESDNSYKLEEICKYIESDSQCMMSIIVEETKLNYGKRLLKVMADELRDKFGREAIIDKPWPKSEPVEPAASVPAEGIATEIEVFCCHCGTKITGPGYTCCAAASFESSVEPAALVVQKIERRYLAVDDIADRLNDIHNAVQGLIHDQWGWMDAAFYVEALRTLALKASQPTPVVVSSLKEGFSEFERLRGWVQPILQAVICDVEGEDRRNPSLYSVRTYLVARDLHKLLAQPLHPDDHLDLSPLLDNSHESATQTAPLPSDQKEIKEEFATEWEKRKETLDEAWDAHCMKSYGLLTEQGKVMFSIGWNAAKGGTN